MMPDSWIPEPVQAESGIDDWKSKLIHNRNGVAPVIANAITALRTAPECAGVLAYDQFSLSAAIISKPPWGGDLGAISDHHDRLAADWLQHQGILIGSDVAGQALQVVAKDAAFHPVADHLNQLEWDHVGRIDGLFSLYCGAEPTEFVGAVGRRWLVAAAARIFQPGCKSDCIPILEGKQGVGKSTALKIIGGQWFTDELPEIGSKDAALQLIGKWIVELAEMDSFGRSETSRIKAFASRSVDRFRPPYGRHVVEAPRQCVFAGTINHETYLRDETGARRFWPVRCTRILVDELARDRDQLLAEAVALYRAGHKWWLDTPELILAAEEEQSARYEGDSWDALISAWLEEQIANGETSISTREILEGCIKKPPAQQVNLDLVRIGRCLRSMRWQRFRLRKPSGLLEWRYRPPVVPGSSTGNNTGNIAT